MDSKKWKQIKKGRFCVGEKVDNVYFEVLFNIGRDFEGDRELTITDVAKFIGKKCVIVPEEEIEANKKFYIDIVAEDTIKRFLIQM